MSNLTIDVGGVQKEGETTLLAGGVEGSAVLKHMKTITSPPRTCGYAYVYLCIFIYIYNLSHTYKHIHTHTYIYIYIVPRWCIIKS